MRVKSLRWPFCVTDVDEEPNELTYPFHPLALTLDEAMSFFWRQRQWSISFDFTTETLAGPFFFSDAQPAGDVPNEKAHIVFCQGITAGTSVNYPFPHPLDGFWEAAFWAFFGANCDGTPNNELAILELYTVVPQNQHLLRYTNPLGQQFYYPFFYFGLRIFGDGVVSEKISTLRAEVQDGVGIGAHLVTSSMQVNGKPVTLFYRAPDGSTSYGFTNVTVAPILYHAFANSEGLLPIYDTATGGQLLNPLSFQNPFE